MLSDPPNDTVSGLEFYKGFGLGIRVQDLKFLGFKVCESRFRVPGLGFVGIQIGVCSPGA